MALRKVIFEGDGWSFVFLVFAFVLAVFSLFYADWYHKNVTGFVTDEGDGAPPPPPPPKGGGAEDIGSSGSNGGSGGGDNSLSIAASATSISHANTVNDLTTDVLVNLPSYVVPSGATSSVSSVQSTPSTPSVSSEPSTIGTPTTVPHPTSCSGSILACQTELTVTQVAVSSAIKTVTDLYQSVLADGKKFPSNQDIKKSITQIGSNLALLFNIDNLISQQLSYTANQITARNIRVAQGIVEHEGVIQENKDFVEEYLVKYEAYTAPAPTQDPFTEITISECDIPADLLAFDIVNDIGNFGVGNGDVCEQNIPKPKPMINLPASGQSQHFPTINVPGVISLPVTSSGVEPFQGVVFSLEPLPGETHVEAFAVALSPTGQFIVGFFSSPSVGNLADEITDFVQKVVLGLHDEVLETKTASAEVLATDLGRNTPWTLWIVLVVAVIPFIFFGNYLLPTHERLILEGKRAIFKGDFGKAIAQYKELIVRYHDLCEYKGSDVRQEILEYFILLRASLTARNVKFSTAVGESKFSNIVLVKNSLTEFQRVELVLHDALHDLKSDRKKAVLRAPAIAGMYSRLERREKEKLAPLYERFVYSIRKV